jgi:hypothetical protein
MEEPKHDSTRLLSLIFRTEKSNPLTPESIGLVFAPYNAGWRSRVASPEVARATHSLPFPIVVALFYSSFALLPHLRPICLSVLLLAAAPRLVQAQTNDGFRRLDGTMYVVRNGEARPMPHDIHLPNGRTVTRDGFIVERDGTRTELAEGRGCTLLGQSTAVRTEANGRLALAAPGGSPAPAAAATEATLVSQFQRWWGGPGRGKAKGHHKNKGKHKPKHQDD